jgi:hypothetical protein
MSQHTAKDPGKDPCAQLLHAAGIGTTVPETRLSKRRGGKEGSDDMRAL